MRTYGRLLGDDSFAPAVRKRDFDLELAKMADPLLPAYLRAHWSADEGHMRSGWVDRVNGIYLRPRVADTTSGIDVREDNARPVAGGPGGRRYVPRDGTDVQELYSDADALVYPLGQSVSFVWIGRPKAGQNGGAVFSNQAPTNATSHSVGYTGAEGAVPGPGLTISLKHDNSALLNTAAGGNDNADGFRTYVVDFKHIGPTQHQVIIRRDGVQIGASAVTDWSARQLTNQAAHMYGRAFSGLQAAVDILDQMVYWGSLTDVANAAHLATIEAYCAKRTEKVFPVA